MIDKKTFLKKFYSFYSYLYDNADVERALYGNVAEFDTQMKTSDAFRAFVRDVVAERGDFFSSDREVIAFMGVFKNMKTA